MANLIDSKGFCAPLAMLSGLSSFVMMKWIVFATRQSLLSLSLTVAMRSFENVPFGALVTRVICHKVSSPSSFFLATEFFLWRPFYNWGSPKGDFLKKWAWSADGGQNTGIYFIFSSLNNISLTALVWKMILLPLGNKIHTLYHCEYINFISLYIEVHQAAFSTLLYIKNREIKRAFLLFTEDSVAILTWRMWKSTLLWFALQLPYLSGCVIHLIIHL